MSWQNLDKSRPDSAHYAVMKCVGNEMAALREMFPKAKADDLNFVLFSTSGVHGTYMTIEEAEEEKTDVTFVIVHPRLVALRYGNVKPETPDDWAFLKMLRQSSWDAARQIGAFGGITGSGRTCGACGKAGCVAGECGDTPLAPQQQQAGAVIDGYVQVPVAAIDILVHKFERAGGISKVAHFGVELGTTSWIVAVTDAMDVLAAAAAPKQEPGA